MIEAATLKKKRTSSRKPEKVGHVCWMRTKSASITRFRYEQWVAGRTKFWWLSFFFAFFATAARLRGLDVILLTPEDKCSFDAMYLYYHPLLSFSMKTVKPLTSVRHFATSMQYVCKYFVSEGTLIVSNAKLCLYHIIYVGRRPASSLASCSTQFLIFCLVSSIALSSRNCF